VVEAAAGGDAVVAATGVAFGARVAREHLGLPLATVHLQPACLRSLEETPVIAGLPFPGRAPRFLKRALYRVVDWFADRELAGPLNAFRARLGLSPCARILGDWWNSPDLILALFPEWFARPQPDWPRQTVATEFPLYDESATLPPCDELERFLAAGEPPIAFTPGSATQGAERFFAAAAGACARLGRRGLLITRYAHQVPASLPEGVRHVAYVPFSRMLPHVAAFVHHGGIGTTAQAFAAAVPQLIVPMSFDQPDNARRVAALGAGRWLPPARVSAGTLARELRILLEDTEVTRQARELAERIPGGARLEQASTVLESWAAGARAVPFAANR
jgi:UDP:flavonoid glycosyltransferase YjiC (YdhE family)